MASSLVLEESYKCQSAITVTVKDTVKMGYYLVTNKHNKVDHSCEALYMYIDEYAPHIQPLRCGFYISYIHCIKILSTIEGT